MELLQGLADHALNVVKAMRADGLEASTVVLNSLINAFGEDRRIAEAFSVLQFMKENVSSCAVLCFAVLSYIVLPLDDHIILEIYPYLMKRHIFCILDCRV